jgi:hypothetical protein
MKIDFKRIDHIQLCIPVGEEDKASASKAFPSRKKHRFRAAEDSRSSILSATVSFSKKPDLFTRRDS